MGYKEDLIESGVLKREKIKKLSEEEDET